MSDLEWSDGNNGDAASCAACAGHGSRPGADGFVPCTACEGTGKIATRVCCPREDDYDHGGVRRFHARGNESNAHVTLEEMMAELDLENALGEPIAASEAFHDKVVGLYFTARHCPACARFSPTLAAFSRDSGETYVTVVVSGDAASDAAEDGFRALATSQGRGTSEESPILRVPFDSPHRPALLRAFKVFAIPSVRVWHPAAKKQVTAWGHTAISLNPKRCVSQWHAGQAGWEVGVLNLINPLPRCVGLAGAGLGGAESAAGGGGRDEEKVGATRVTPPRLNAALREDAGACASLQRSKA